MVVDVMDQVRQAGIMNASLATEVSGL